MNSILLEKSDSNSPGTKKSKSNRTPDDMKRELDKVLKDGFNTFYGGSFLLIPYLLHLGIVEKINALNVDKQNGIPVEKAVLALLNMGIVGKKRICRVANVTDQGLAVFAGLGKMPDPSFFHDFLDKVKTSDAEQFNIRCSRRFKEMGLKYVTILKLYQNRVEEMKSIPAGQFREMADGRQIAFIHTSLRNYQGEAKLIVIWFQEDGEDKYYGYLTNDEGTPEEETVAIYGKRWGIENFLKEAIFLNIDKLPGTELNKISAMLAIKLVGYCTVSCLRRDIGGDYAKMEIEGMFEKILNVQAFVRSKGEKIHVTYYRYSPELVPLFQGLNEKLKSKGINPKIPWLSNKILEFHFK